MARLIGVTPPTLLDWARCGRVPCIRVSQKTYRFDPAEVLEYLRAKSGEGVAQ